MGGSDRETPATDESTDRTTSDPSANRRSVLRALGAGGALAAFAGTSGARERARQDGDIDPVWGFPALSEETDPPTGPDHEVRLQIRPRDAPIPEFVFEPTGLAVEPGDTVRFSYESPHHTVTAYHPAFGYLRRVPDEVPPFSAPPLPQGGYWLYTFDRSGVYDLHCAPHEIFGHAMRIVVGSPSGPAADPLPDLCAGRAATTGTGGETTAGTGSEATTETQPTTGNATTAGGETTESGEGGEREGGEPELEPPRVTAYTVLSDPALDPDAIVESNRVSWDDLAPESKRLFVQVRGFPPC